MKARAEISESRLRRRRHGRSLAATHTVLSGIDFKVLEGELPLFGS